MGTLNFNLTEAELKQIINKYRENQGLINYASFCAKIDEVFCDTVNQKDVINESKSSAKFTQEE